MITNIHEAVKTVHRANIGRYRRLLAGSLTDHERQFITRRLAEEQDALRKASPPHGPLDLAME